MALEDLLSVTASKSVDYDDMLTKENLAKDMPAYRDMVSFWRMYPDCFVDFLCSTNPDNTFSLRFYQRMLLRSFARHRYSFITMTRGASKSFTVILFLMINAVLYPGSNSFVVSGMKQQSAEIVQAKMNELCTMIPALAHEIIWDTRGTRAQTKQNKDTVVYSFKNGSSIKNIVAGEQTRGARYHLGVMEECIGIDQDMLEQVIIPTLNVDRQVGGVTDPDEMSNKTQIFITTSGYKNTASYANLLQILCRSVVNPKNAIVLGADWKLSVIEGALEKDFVKDLKANGSFDESTFEREYGSVWQGDVENAFFASDKFDKQRKLILAESKYNEKLQGKDYYVMGVDVGRFGCTTEVAIIKVTWAPTGAPIKQLVNIYSYEEEHFGMQAIQLKRLFQRFKCKCCVVDGNGLGAGLVDFLVTDQIDPETNETLYNWGVSNDPDGTYKRFQTEDTIYNAMYVMKATNVINSELYSYTNAQLLNSKLRFLIDDAEAKAKLMDMKRYKDMTNAQREDYLRPYKLTSILKAEMMNLISTTDGALIKLNQANPRIRKDKFSALIYGLFYCKEQERKSSEKNRNFSDFMLFTPHNWA